MNEEKWIYKPIAWLAVYTCCCYVMACAKYAPDGLSAIEIGAAADVALILYDQQNKGKLENVGILAGKFIGYGLLIFAGSLFFEGHFIDFGRYF